ncbi:MAG: hypothetical protein JWN33_17 [Candidatus Saccharibacteria bacterium]|nr:hypothetical protein [Candidatus Saccharibacteria bacterium]
MAPAAGLSRYIIVAFRKVNFPALLLAIAPQPSIATALRLLVQIKQQNIEKALDQKI